MAKKFEIDALVGTQEKLTAPRISMIAIEDLVPNENNNALYSLGDLSVLKADISAVGVRQPLEVVPAKAEGKYMIVGGHRRHAACCALNEEAAVRGEAQPLQKLPCLVDRSSTDLETEVRLVLANATARELSALERVRQYARLKQLFEQMKARGEGGRVREKVQQALNLSAGAAARLNVVAENLTPELGRALEDGSITFTEAYELSRRGETLEAYRLRTQAQGEQEKRTQASAQPSSQKQPPLPRLPKELKPHVKRLLALRAETQETALRQAAEAAVVLMQKQTIATVEDTNKCPQCGCAPLLPRTHFCPDCGQRLTLATDAARAADDAFSDFRTARVLRRWVAAGHDILCEDGTPERETARHELNLDYCRVFDACVHVCEGMDSEQERIWMNPSARAENGGEYWVQRTASNGQPASRQIAQCPHCGAQLRDGAGDVILRRTSRALWVKAGLLDALPTEVTVHDA